MSARIVLVGHCGVDAPRLEAEVSRCFPRADVITINSEQQLEDICDEGADLLLINRKLPFGFEAEEGLELIHALQQEHPDIKLMLVSDHEDAQAEARAAGAIEGFGKADLGTRRFASCLRDALRGQIKPN